MGSDQISSSRLYPNSVRTSDALHVLHGGFEEVLKRSQLWTESKQALRDIGNFLNDRPLRFRFRARCCPTFEIAQKFIYWSRTDVEFDFEFLELLLVPLDAVLEDLWPHGGTHKNKNKGSQKE